MYHFSEKGFFDADKINRSLLDSLLRIVMADAKVTQLTGGISATSPTPESRLWDCLAKLVGYLEKFLFANYQSQEGELLSHPPILLM